MSDNFEFDDDDDVLINAFCTPPSENTSPEKRSKEENDENLPVKRPKPNENTSPIIQFSQKISKTAIKSSPLRNDSLPNCSKRIFPGPAGILSDENQTDICSQDTSSLFQDGPWKEMSKDFNISKSLCIFDQFNIAWIKREATANQFVNQKAPFLAGILLSLEVSEGHTQKTINITLKDMTGTIQGTILQNLYEEYASDFTLGSVLILIQFGVLSCTCDKCDNHHLTITPKNLSAIYSGKGKIVIKQVDPEEVLKEYCQRKKELKLVTRDTHLSRQNNSGSPLMPSENINRCTYRKPGFSSSCASKSSLSPNVNKATTSSFQKTNDSSESLLLPIGRIIDKGIIETKTARETCESISPATIGTTSPKRLFTFKKLSTSPQYPSLNETKCSPLNNISTITLMDSSPKSQNSRQTDYINKNQEVNYKSMDSVKIGKSPLSVKVDNVEHEEIWKDALADMDVNSLFEDDF